MTTWTKLVPEISDFSKDEINRNYGFDIGLFDICRFDGQYEPGWDKRDKENLLFTAGSSASTSWAKRSAAISIWE